MGSPNFYTNPNLLANFGIDSYAYSPEGCDSFHHELTAAQKIAEEFILDLPRMYFHEIVMRGGYHEGCQLYLEANYGLDLDGYAQRTLNDFELYDSTTDTNGYEFDLLECEYFRSNIKNATLNNIKQGILKERRVLSELLKAKALQIGMGEIIGSSWTSSVNYSNIKTTQEAA